MRSRSWLVGTFLGLSLLNASVAWAQQPSMPALQPLLPQQAGYDVPYNPVGSVPLQGHIAPTGFFQQPPLDAPLPSVPQPMPPGEPTFGEVLRRLERAEAELDALQSLPPASALPPEEKKDNEPKKKAWYEKLSIRGYAQFRFNETLHEEPGSAPVQHAGDRSVGDDQNFLIRRARLIIAGDVSDHMYVYLQPDFASSVPGSPDATYFAQIRDWYADCYIDKTKIYRIRVGQSKVPYGFENLQSSSNRIPLDRSDSFNSAVRNERDLGVFFYWTPEYAQDFFKEVLDKGLKGSGNYGVFGFGAYNGQGGSLLEQNDDLHLVARLEIPYQFPNGQYMEAGVQAYTGKYTTLSSTISPLGVGPGTFRPTGTLETNGRDGNRDQRIGGTFVWYPQPFGLQAEWNVGNGPGLNDAQTEVVSRHLYGGYAMAMYRYESECYGIFFPFVRYNKYQGGYKPERNSPFSNIEEWETGVEWQMNPQMELTMQYTFADRTNTTAFSTANTASYRQFEGDLLRVQFQVNY